MNQVEPQLYIDLSNLMDQECIERYRELKLNRLRGIKQVSTAKTHALIDQECVEQIESS